MNDGDMCIKLKIRGNVKCCTQVCSPSPSKISVQTPLLHNKTSVYILLTSECQYSTTIIYVTLNCFLRCIYSIHAMC